MTAAHPPAHLRPGRPVRLCPPARRPGLLSDAHLGVRVGFSLFDATRFSGWFSGAVGLSLVWDTSGAQVARSHGPSPSPACSGCSLKSDSMDRHASTRLPGLLRGPLPARRPRGRPVLAHRAQDLPARPLRSSPPATSQAPARPSVPGGHGPPGPRSTAPRGTELAAGPALLCACRGRGLAAACRMPLGLPPCCPAWTGSPPVSAPCPARELLATAARLPPGRRASLSPPLAPPSPALL